MDQDTALKLAMLLRGNPYGMTQPGNINIFQRPTMQNADGSVSTVRSLGFNDGNGEVLIPTIGMQAQDYTPRQAIQNHFQTGQHLGRFKTPQGSDAYAQALHEQQETFYGGDHLPLRLDTSLK